MSRNFVRCCSYPLADSSCASSAIMHYSMVRSACPAATPSSYEGCSRRPRSGRIGRATSTPCSSRAEALGCANPALRVKTRCRVLNAGGLGRSPFAYACRAISVAAAVTANGGIMLAGAPYGTRAAVLAGRHHHLYHLHHLPSLRARPSVRSCSSRAGRRTIRSSFRCVRCFVCLVLSLRAWSFGL